MAEDYDEEEVWSILKDDHQSPTFKKSPSKDQYSKMIRRSTNSNSHGGDHSRPPVRQSAPMNIPDRSKIYGHRGDDPHAAVEDGGEEDDEVGGVPPHEWLAKKLAKSQISSFSVCEGAGRTLKGRDLSKVRNAVLTRTGFIE